MNVVDKITTRKDNDNQNSFSIINKMITKSNSPKIKSKQNNLIFTSLKKYATCPQCDWLVGRQKRAKRCEVQKYVPIFEKN